MVSPRALSRTCGSKESRPAWIGDMEIQHKLKSARDIATKGTSREGFGNPAKGNRILIYETLAALRYIAFRW